MQNLTAASRSKSARKSTSAFNLDPLESRKLMSAVAAVKIPLVAFPAKVPADFVTLSLVTAPKAITPGSVLTTKPALTTVKPIVGPIRDGSVVSSDASAMDHIGYTPTSTQLSNPTGMLTAAKSGDALTIATDYFKANAAKFGLAAADFDNLTVTNRYTDSDTGVTHIYFRQTYNGLPVMNSDMSAHVMSDGRILTVQAGIVGGLANANVSTTPTITAATALAGIADDLKLTLVGSIIQNTAARSRDLKQTFTAAGLSLDEVPASLVYVPKVGGGVTLAWELVVRPDDDRWLDLTVDATTNQILSISNWVDADSYNVYELPKESPYDGARTIATNPQNFVASPFGWHDTNGVAGAEFTITRGNNVNSYLDRDANNAVDAGSQPDGTASLTFNTPIDLTQAPTVATNQQSAVIQLFYLNNMIHDTAYKYGFTEAAANFQANNYGKGGTGNDAVNAEAQDGSGTSNANFATPAEGGAPRMQMYLFTSPNPDRDGDLDAGIVIHEYTHGISTRLTGGGTNANSLNNFQSASMGEGWGDWLGLMMTQTASDSKNDSFWTGTYALGNAATGPGIRTEPYSFDMAKNPNTFTEFGSTTDVHFGGELWASALWDLNWLLIDKYGYNSDLSTGYVAGGNAAQTAGNKLALKLVFDGMKTQGSNPTVIQARNAILSADTALTGGANARQIWQAFARRGLGSSASTSSSSSSTIATAFDLPTTLEAFVTGSTPAGTAPLINSATLTFSEPMVASSFSIADDVTSFTGPSGSLLSSITGFTWVDSKTLKINVAPQAASGTYTLNIGPNILAVDNNHALDQDGDNVVGEASDGYSATVNVARLGPDTFGYQAGASLLSLPALVPGTAGVTSLAALDGVDDTSAVLPLGTNTFNFYGTTYTASTLIAGTNGLLNFASGNTSNPNTDLGSTPTQATVAPLWDDYVTSVVAGTSGDQVLYSFQDVDANGINDRLVVQWNDVRQFDTQANGVTFQAILQINTGATPGTILFNYIDLNIGNPAYSNGASATTGIKNSGAQSTAVNSQRLLVNQNNGTGGFVQPGQAIRIATDWNAPTVTNTVLNLGSATSTVDYTFSRDVGASLTAADLSLFNASLGTTVNAASVAYNAGTNTATFTFPALVGGAYAATLSTSGVYDATLGTLVSSPTTNFLYAANDDDFAISKDGAGNTLLRQGATTFSSPTASLVAAYVNGGTGNDVLTVDLVNGNPIPTSFVYDGGSAGDSLVIAGTSGVETVTVSGSTVNFSTGSITPLSIDSIFLNLAGGNDTVTLAPAASTPSVSLNLGAGQNTLNVNAGSYDFDSDASVLNGSLTINAATGTTVNFSGTQHLASLNLSAGATANMAAGSNVLSVKNLVIAGGATPTATLNLNDNDLIFDYSGATLGTKLTTLWAQILAGRGTADANGLYSQNGFGVRTGTGGLANAAAGFNKFALGVVNNADLGVDAFATFAGESVAGSTLLVKYTYNGDTNLSGKIDFSDYGNLPVSMAVPPANATWLDGDFTGDGIINADDYSVIDFGKLMQGLQL